MRLFFLGLSVVLLACAAVVAYVDPAHRWRGARAVPERRLETGELQVHPRDVDERALKARMIAESGPLDVVILGSSRSMLLGADAFKPGARVLNLGVSGASIEDLVALETLLIEARSQTPPLAVVWIDPWLFNTRDEQERWVTISAAYKRGLDRLDAPLRYRFTAELDTLIARGAEIAELVSWSSLRASAGGLRRRMRGKSTDNGYAVKPLADVAPEETGTAWDGVHRYEASSYVPLASAEIAANARAFALGNKVYSLGEWSFDERSMALLEKLLADLKQRGSKVVLIMPPYQPEALRLLRGRPAYRRALEAYQAAVPARLGPVCDVMDPATLGCAPEEFMDGMHTLPSCMDKLIARCLTGAVPEWMATTTATSAATTRTATTAR